MSRSITSERRGLRTALGREARLFFTALQFLTRLPVPRWVGFEHAWLTHCIRHFPLVGALVGAAGAAVALAAAALWPPAVAALLALAGTVALTGGFHEDGLADTFDALGGVVPRERALAIMKDSRIGSYGALALVLSLLLRAALMAALLERARSPWGAGAWGFAAALVLSHTLARGAAVVVMAWLPYAGDAEHAKAKPLALDVRRRDVVVALAECLAIGAALAPWVGPSAGVGSIAAAPVAVPLVALAAALVAALGVALLMRRWLRRRLGGFTGDTLGATEQLAELAVLLALLGVGAT